MNLVVEMDVVEPLQVLYTDFTEIWYVRGGKKAYLMLCWIMRQSGSWTGC